jgi:L-threonylcarbamoyladenylate synthase
VIMARILDAAQSGAIIIAADIIRNGGVVAFPTETVYGLGADACNSLAVAHIFELKHRPAFNPLILHVADSEAAERHGIFSHPLAIPLTRRFWPGPLTLVVPKKQVVPPIVTAGLETVAIRMPAHPVALALIRATGCAIAAPSANPSGYVSPTEAHHVAEGIPEVDLILDGGRCPVGLESTIISLASETPIILRSGGVSAEEIETLAGPLKYESSSSRRPSAPGQLARHYATKTRLEIQCETAEARPFGPKERVGLLTLTPPAKGHRYAAVEILSPKGDLREAAANLFSSLRMLDSLCLDRIIAHPVPEHGIGIAIMDRLRRCSALESPDAVELPQ